MLTTDTAGGNRDLADRAVRLGRQHPPRTADRRAAAAVYVALTTTKTTEAARKALATFGDPVTQAAARALLSQIEQETSGPSRGRAG